MQIKNMEGWILLGVILIFAAYFLGRVGYAIENDKTEVSDYEKMNESIDDALNEEDKKTCNLLMKTLKDIGCQYEIDDDNSIVFKYQGEDFKIDANNDSRIIWIYDIAWGGMDINDPNADYLKQAINESNKNGAITSLYTINEERGHIVVHSKIVTYFAYSILDYEGYLKSILDGFFIAQQQVKDGITNLGKIQEQKERVRIKGFKQE